jgi:hypothetical protein
MALDPVDAIRAVSRRRAKVLKANILVGVETFSLVLCSQPVVIFYVVYKILNTSARSSTLQGYVSRLGVTSADQ